MADEPVKPEPQITYADQTTLLNVAEFEEWWSTWLPLSDLCCLTTPIYQHNGRLDSRSGNTLPVGLPRPNYPQAPPIRLNTLYWPTGASRWAFMFLIVDDDSKEAISANGSASQALVLSDGETRLETQMYALPPRRITAADSNYAWLVPLVDERYWWQFQDVNSEVLTTTTWPALFAGIAASAGIDAAPLFDTPAAYLRPDPQELTRRYGNVAVMLDAVASSLGYRMLRLLGGAVGAQKWANAEDSFQHNSQDDEANAKILGGFDSAADAFIPSSLRVVFPKMREYRPYADRPYSIASPVRPTYHTETVGLSGSSPAVKTVHSTCFALTGPASETVTNTGELAALAAQIAADYELSLKHCYDFTFGGLYNWNPCGYDDHIEWTIGRLHPGTHGDYLVRTRVQSAPYNFGTEEQLSQQSAQFVLPEFGTGILDDPLSPAGQATVSVYYHDGSGWTDTDVDIECFEHIMSDGAAAVAAGKQCYFNWDKNSNRWLITQVEC